MVRIACHNRCQPTKWNPSRGHNFRVSIALLVGCCVVLNSCRVCSSNDSIIFYYYYLFLFLVTGCRHVTLYTFHALWCVCVCMLYMISVCISSTEILFIRCWTHSCSAHNSSNGYEKKTKTFDSNHWIGYVANWMVGYLLAVIWMDLYSGTNSTCEHANSGFISLFSSCGINSLLVGRSTVEIERVEQ